MPSFTFAAAAQAALWCGLTPLLCDIDAQTWLPSRESEERLLAKYAGEIAVIVPYATFGNNLDLERYERLSQLHDIPIVVDAAASLGSKDTLGRPFGAGFPWPVVFSMHATKSFSVGEGGLLYCADRHRLDRLRSMASFGFGEPRNATMLGLNAKLTEIAALTALLQLRRMDSFVEHSAHLSQRYRQQLHQDLQMQRTVGHQVKAFESVLLPTGYAEVRPKVMRQLTEMGVGSAHYFSPHLAEQPYLVQNSMAGPLPVTCDIASRILTLPLHADMSTEQVDWIAKSLNEAIANCLPRDLTRKVTTSGITSRGTSEAEHVSRVLPAA